MITDSYAPQTLRLMLMTDIGYQNVVTSSHKIQVIKAFILIFKFS